MTRALVGHETFLARLDAELARAKKHQRPLAIAMLQAQDTARGHVAFWAARVSCALRPYDVAAFYASRCVEIVLPEHDSAGAEALLKTLHERARPTALRSALCVYPEGGHDTETVIASLRRSLAQPARVEGDIATKAAKATKATKATKVEAPFLPASEWLPKTLQETLARLAPGRSTLCIIGETGTGKERWARELHRLGPHAAAPFVAVNCAAIPETLLESTLFGHRAGAFTGAQTAHAGIFEQAGEGTLFLDPIDALSPRAQGVLLQVFDAREVTPVGASEGVTIHARVIAATHGDLDALIAAGRLREDLRFRLGAAPVELPPLRGRRNLIARLAEHAVRTCAQENDLAPVAIDAAVIERLCAYRWPGNMRELRNVIERATFLASDHTICVQDLPEKIQRAGHVPSQGIVDHHEGSFKARVQHLERALIVSALRATEGNQSDAARMLEIPRRTLVHKLKSLGIRALFSGARKP
ncbi:MAG: sigma 54-interacting transcriptional regulator [Deltaproteobacteria bacterium]|nr:sigma 54-interacting transcriptional regulator [Deltaproteobacteria bacterium]